MEDADRQKCLQLITRKLVFLTSGCMLLIFIIFYIIIPFLVNTEHKFLNVYVFIAGLIGGFVSIQQRLPNIGLNELQELSNSWSSILLIPVNGGIFAIVLMLMFVSGLLEGAMFPKYIHATLDHQNITSSFLTWLKKTFPATGADIAKLLFWSFVAGFSERFVPQVIRKATIDLDQSVQKDHNG